MFTRRVLLTTAASAAALSATALLSVPAFADQPEVFASGGVAINGYDPVSYFTEGKPIAGDPAHVVTWKGAEWRFSNAGNAALFAEAPEDYAPQFGGYCAYAVSEGYTAKTEPEAWSIENGKLYLNYSLRVRRIWNRDIPGHIARGEANWPGVLTR